MKILVWFTAYYWDNHQGGSGKYIDSKLLVEIDNDVASYMVWEKVHDKIKRHLERNRPFNQSIYLKTQGEYTISKAELI